MFLFLKEFLVTLYVCPETWKQMIYFSGKKSPITRQLLKKKEKLHDMLREKIEQFQTNEKPKKQRRALQVLKVIVLLV